MKNLKNAIAMLVLVTMMSVSTTFGGVYYTDRSRGVQEAPTAGSCGTGTSVGSGVILSGVILSGVILSGVILSGVILSGTGRGASTLCNNDTPIGTQD